MHSNHTPGAHALKTCSNCGEPKPATTEYFSRNRARHDGWANQCKTCKAEIQRLDREQVNRRNRESYARHREERIASRQSRQPEKQAYNKAYWAANKDRLTEQNRAWYSENRAKQLEYKRDYREANKETSIQRDRKYYGKNKERIAERMKLYRKNNREVVRAARQRRRGRISAAFGTHTGEDIRRLYTTQEGRCFWCCSELTPLYHVDHVVPLARGGTNDPSNLVLSCPSCNQSKGSKLPSEWLGGDWKP